MKLPGSIRSLWGTFGPQATKFCIVGAIGTAISYGLLYVLTERFGVYYIYSSWIGIVIGQVVAFMGYKYWAFVIKTTKQMYSTKFQFLMHWTVWSIGLCIATGILYSLTTWLHLWYMLSNVAATVVSGSSNFLSHKYFTYRPK
jgi:putative flippase GtrA